MRVLITGVIFLISVNACSFFLKSHHYKKPYLATQTDRELLKYFEENSQDSLKQFFNNWENELRPYSRSKIEGLNDTLKAIYAVFNIFYTTKPAYFGFKYIILQNSISYAVIRDIAVFEKYTMERRQKDTITPDTLTDFRPYKGKAFNQILYLNDKYKSALNYFFNEENGNYNCIQNFDKELTEKKRTFLSSYISLPADHRCKMYYSFPYIEKIIFNSDLSGAKIFFRNSVSSGGGKVYSIIDGKWTFIKDLLYWAAVS